MRANELATLFPRNARSGFSTKNRAFGGGISTKKKQEMRWHG
ncbi:hypothetical protein EV663_105128 [Rhodovulum bhavnagarense]|uniref:Uncharacterized protein n=1 Tax=Rhodovulum bhavnagarense TaxID=992286 RepID=A0A4R2RD91_9RHOB|nr:hypothetical protein EV663_105128 [Rhodovulum bhavnagarense]